MGPGSVLSTGRGGRWGRRASGVAAQWRGGRAGACSGRWSHARQPFPRPRRCRCGRRAGDLTVSRGVLPPSVKGRLRTIRAHPLLNPTALIEGWRERLGGYPEDPEHEPHLATAIEWLVRAQDATPDGGISRGFSLAWHPYFGGRGWQPSYPETTGYIIPTLYAAARRLGRAELAARAERAARWEIEIQLPTGAIRGGVIGAPESPPCSTPDRCCSAGSRRSRRQGRAGSPTRPAAPLATWWQLSTRMGFGAGGTRSSRALTRRCTTRAPPGRSPKRELDWMMAGSPMPPPAACAPPPRCRPRTAGCLPAASPIPSSRCAPRSPAPSGDSWKAGGCTTTRVCSRRRSAQLMRSWQRSGRTAG